MSTNNKLTRKPFTQGRTDHSLAIF